MSQQPITFAANDKPHSRKETARTAKVIRDMALAESRKASFVPDESESKRILNEVILEKKMATSKDL